jgi:hypothetical protein
VGAQPQEVERRASRTSGPPLWRVASRARLERLPPRRCDPAASPGPGRPRGRSNWGLLDPESFSWPGEMCRSCALPWLSPPAVISMATATDKAALGTARVAGDSIPLDQLVALGHHALIPLWSLDVFCVGVCVGGAASSFGPGFPAASATAPVSVVHAPQPPPDLASARRCSPGPAQPGQCMFSVMGPAIVTAGPDGSTSGTG